MDAKPNSIRIHIETRKITGVTGRARNRDMMYTIASDHASQMEMAGENGDNRPCVLVNKAEQLIARAQAKVKNFNDPAFRRFAIDCHVHVGLGRFFANRFTRDGCFVALPGYEWTSRLPYSPERLIVLSTR